MPDPQLRQIEIEIRDLRESSRELILQLIAMRERDEQRHEETMTALHEQHEETRALRRTSDLQTEELRTVGRTLGQQADELKLQNAALRLLLERLERRDGDAA